MGKILQVFLKILQQAGIIVWIEPEQVQDGFLMREQGGEKLFLIDCTDKMVSSPLTFIMELPKLSTGLLHLL